MKYSTKVFGTGHQDVRDSVGRVRIVAETEDDAKLLARFVQRLNLEDLIQVAQGFRQTREEDKR